MVNPLVSRLQTGGVATLTVPGRRTGRARMVPVIPVEVGGIRYLVSPYGESVWVRNLRAAGKATLARKGKVETFQASEIAVPGRAAIIAAYRKVCDAPWTRVSPNCQIPATIRCFAWMRSAPPAGHSTIPAGAGSCIAGGFGC